MVLNSQLFVSSSQCMYAIKYKSLIAIVALLNV